MRSCTAAYATSVATHGCTLPRSPDVRAARCRPARRKWNIADMATSFYTDQGNSRVREVQLHPERASLLRRADDQLAAVRPSTKHRANRTAVFRDSEAMHVVRSAPEISLTMALTVVFEAYNLSDGGRCRSRMDKARLQRLFRDTELRNNADFSATEIDAAFCKIKPASQSALDFAGFMCGCALLAPTSGGDGPSHAAQTGSLTPEAGWLRDAVLASSKRVTSDLNASWPNRSHQRSTGAARTRAGEGVGEEGGAGMAERALGRGLVDLQHWLRRPVRRERGSLAARLAGCGHVRSSSECRSTTCVCVLWRSVGQSEMAWRCASCHCLAIEPNLSQDVLRVVLAAAGGQTSAGSCALRHPHYPMCTSACWAV